MAEAAEPPFHPIVYVRGYAGNDAEVDDTAADPYMGFNLGATAVRQDWEGKVFRHYFESPLLRLMKEHGYRDIYHAGEAMPPGREIPWRSVFIYRYYDDVSNLLGAGVRPEIERYAEGLEVYLKQIRDRICGEDEDARRDFRVYLVAHSMGGLVCRCFLQNVGTKAARRMVDKVFTYATPHNGIDLQILGNVPGIFSRNNTENFNRGRMREYLGLDAEAEDEASVASLNGAFDPDRFFCLVGTNHRDYEAARGWARRVVGPMSDGLVRIANATVHGPWKEWRPGSRRKVTVEKHAPRSYVHRSHSGHFGIVNSEDGYQNMARFLFGDLRVDGLLKVRELTLPPRVQEAYDEDRTVRASYHFDAVVRVRGARWDLSRRRTDEGSAVFRKFDDMFPRESGARPRHPHLFSTYLALWGRSEERASMGFSLDLAVHVPEYEVDGLLWLDDHYPGGTLYREKLNFELWPPGEEGDEWELRWGRDSVSPNRAETVLEPREIDELEGLPPGFVLRGDTVYTVPVRQETRPGMDAELVLRARPWA